MMQKYPKQLKILAIIVISIIIVVGLAISIVVVLRNVTPQRGDNSSQTAKIEALRTSAANDENKGDTDAAIKTYKQILSEYKSDSDTNTRADIEAHIKQLEAIKAADAATAQQEAADAKKRAAEAGAPDPSTDTVPR
jgi:cytoskeletal protein RodZ